MAHLIMVSPTYNSIIFSWFQTCQISSSLLWEENWRALVKSNHFAESGKKRLISCSLHTWSAVPQLVSLTLHGVMGSLWPEVISELWCFCLSHSIAPPLASLSFRRHWATLVLNLWQENIVLNGPLFTTLSSLTKCLLVVVIGHNNSWEDLL